MSSFLFLFFFFFFLLHNFFLIPLLLLFSFLFLFSLFSEKKSPKMENRRKMGGKFLAKDEAKDDAKDGCVRKRVFRAKRKPEGAKAAPTEQRMSRAREVQRVMEDDIS